jgi:hypothetical protein
LIFASRKVCIKSSAHDYGVEDELKSSPSLSAMLRAKSEEKHNVVDTERLTIDLFQVCGMMYFCVIERSLAKGNYPCWRA